MKRNFARLLGILLITCLVSCVTPPKVTPCSIVNVDVAECRPPGEPDYDIALTEMLAYTCFSPEDLGEIKKYVRKVIAEFETQAEFTQFIINQRSTSMVGSDRARWQQPGRDGSDVPGHSGTGGR